MTERAGADDKSPLEQACDVFLYAPLGLALEARNLLPQLIERGRAQVTMARMIGHFAVQKGQSDATTVLGRAGIQANAVLAELGLLPRNGQTNHRSPASTPPEPMPDAVAAEPPEVDDVLLARDRAAAAPLASGLAIADYDSLAASQVIPRLPGLSTDELEAVRAYEAVNRGRKTVLNRIAQLQSA